jgi:hypothetical protein
VQQHLHPPQHAVPLAAHCLLLTADACIQNMPHIQLLTLLHRVLDLLLPFIALLLLLLVVVLWLPLPLAHLPQLLQRLHRLQQDVRSSSGLPSGS